MITFTEYSDKFKHFVVQGLLDIHRIEKDTRTDLKVSDDFDFQIEQWLQNVIQQPASLIILASKNSQPVGFIMGMVEPQNNSFSQYNLHGLIQAIFVPKANRRQHIGQQLVDEMLSSFNEHCIAYCDLSYHPQNAVAMKFWERQGFIPAQIISRKFLDFSLPEEIK